MPRSKVAPKVKYTLVHAPLASHPKIEYNVVTIVTTSERDEMPDVGVRELKTRASEIIRSVRENRARYTITYRGQPVGVLMPLEQPQAEPTIGGEALAESAWDELVRLGQEIGRGWRSPLTSAELLSEMRR